jgi:mercuric ion binding protein
MKQLSIFILGLVVVTFFFAGPTSADSTKVSLRVDGLACPFCAYGLEKKLKEIDNVEKLDIKINEGLVILKFKEGTKIDKEVIFQKVKEAGFTPKDLKTEGASKEVAQAQDASKGQKIALNIQGMVCEGCVARVKTVLNDLDCVEAVKVDLSAEKATLTCNDEKADPSKFVQAVEKLGFKAAVSEKKTK